MFMTGTQVPRPVPVCQAHYPEARCKVAAARTYTEAVGWDAGIEAAVYLFTVFDLIC